MSRALFLVLVCVTACGVSSFVINVNVAKFRKEVQPRVGERASELIVGTFDPNDRLAQNMDWLTDGEEGVVYNQSALFGVNDCTYVHVAEVGESQNANVYLLEGGVGDDNILLNFVSDVGRGMHFHIEMYGTPYPTTETPHKRSSLRV